MDLIKKFNDDCIIFTKILNTYFTTFRVKYFLNCDLVEMKFIKEVDTILLEPPLKGLISKFLINIPLVDSLLIDYTKKGFEIEKFINEVKEKLVFLFEHHKQSTTQLLEIFNSIDIDNFFTYNKIGPNVKHIVTKNAAQLYIKSNIGFDTFIVQLKIQKEIRKIILYKFSNSFRENFIRSNYHLIMKQEWKSEDLLVLKSMNYNTVYMYRLSTNELTMAFSPFNPNKYNYFKSWYSESAMQEFIEVKIDENFNEIERLG